MPTESQRKHIFEKLGYEPSPEQNLVHQCNARIRQAAGGERSGKSKLSIMDLMSRFYEGQLYWLVAADYERTRPEYGYCCEALTKLGIPFEATKKIDPGEIIFEGGFKIVTKSAKDPRTLASTAPDGIVVCEASQIDYETFLRVRGRLAEKRGWLLLAGTFETSLGWYVDLFNLGQTPNNLDLTSFSIPTWANRAIFPGGRDDPELKLIENGVSPEWFMERFGGIPCPPKGLVFQDFRSHIHTGSGDVFDYDPTLPVYLFVDPGYRHAYAVEVAQKKSEQIVVVDEIYERGMTTEDIITIADVKPWREKVIGGAIDVAGTQHQGTSPPAQIWAEKAKIALRSQRVMVPDGIERVKSCLKVNPITNRPYLLVNTKCRGLISEFGGCPNPFDGQVRPYKWRVDNSGLTTGKVPDDKNNDAIKALTYGLIDLLGYVNNKSSKIKVTYH